MGEGKEFGIPQMPKGEVKKEEQELPVEKIERGIDFEKEKVLTVSELKNLLGEEEAKGNGDMEIKMVIVTDSEEQETVSASAIRARWINKKFQISGDKND